MTAGTITPLNLEDGDQRSVGERIDLLRRLRAMLELQREKFRSYLQVLEQQKSSINQGDTRALEAQAKMEQQIVREIFAVQKVVKPLDAMYGKMYPTKKEDITLLQTSLSHLGQQVLERNEINRMLLGKKRDELGKKIDSLRVPKGRKSIYARTSFPGLIDISV